MKITKDQYKQALLAEGILKERSIELFNMLYDSPNCEATAPQLAQMFGYTDFPPVNALIGNLGKRIAHYLRIDISSSWWRVIAHGEQKPDGFTWRLREELFDALVELGLLQDSETTLYPEVISPTVNLPEGKKKQVIVNTFERNTVARNLCIKYFGAQCSVCDFDFDKKYGTIGKGFIHVHHLVELSTIGAEYKVNPITDLRPVCPNCHAMLHQKSPAYNIEELRDIIAKNI